MNLALMAAVAPAIFVAELPDKTALASLMLGARYRASWVFAGVATAFALHVTLAIAAGSLLGLLPHRLLEGIVGAVFLIGALLILREGGDDDGEDDEAASVREPDKATFFRVSLTSFLVIIVAEFGDLTQILTANLAAKYHDPFAVGVGAIIGLWAVSGIAILGGQSLLRVVPMRWIVRVAALVMAVAAVISLVTALGG
jgi:putative Ca2+/H+ antiporter (TMEM165/GDT1 family)